jgi:hypothetical protein
MEPRDSRHPRLTRRTRRCPERGVGKKDARSDPSNTSTVGPPYSSKVPRPAGEPSLSPERTPTGRSTSTSSTEGTRSRWATMRRPRVDIGRAARTRFLKSWPGTLPERGSPQRSCAVPATDRERISGGEDAKEARFRTAAQMVEMWRGLDLFPARRAPRLLERLRKSPDLR